MNLKLYFNQSDYRMINKILVGETNFEGQARDATNILNPVILVDNPAIVNFNYAYIPQFSRYYTITEITAYREGLWEVSMEVDVLMSFRQDIFNLGVIVDKQSMLTHGDEYIDDSSLVADNVEFITTYNFSYGFLDDPELILITAG